jgi:hypothetical protein
VLLLSDELYKIGITNGNIECLKYAHENGYPCDENTYNGASQNNCPYDSYLEDYWLVYL